ncbi:hypothetical protein [Saccharopolyspora sp. 5N708]|uniref:hypothetical protein n=1 Tax=Saccharopolyspora sp. 5N708 TaxID=3457424 RepID=UPI003FCFD627
MRIKRAVTYVGVWLAATTAGITLSWLGVRDVIRGAMFDESDAVPVVRPVATAPAESAPATTDAAPPPPVVPPRPTTVDPATPEQPQSTPKPPPSADDAGDVRTYELKGGKVVLSVRTDGAALISATPRSGYTVQTWDRQEGWLRVEFTADQHGSTVIATWHDHPIKVETQEY